MPFRIKNITSYNVQIMGILVGPNVDIDLLQHKSISEITSSLLFGELFQKLIGRVLTLRAPIPDVDSLSLTTDQFSQLAATGLLQGKLGTEQLNPYIPLASDGKLSVSNPPFIFDGYGALITTGGGGGGSSTSYVQSQIANAIDVAPGTYSYYIDMNGWKYLGLFVIFGANTTGTIWVSGEFNAISSSANYVDMTNYLTQANTLPANDKHVINIDTPLPFRWVKVSVIAADTTNSHSIWAQKMY